MAEKKVIEIEVKTQDAVKSMDALSKSTKEAGKEFDKTATFAERYGEELQPLTTRMGEAEDRLYELANAGQTTTQEYKELLKTVGEFRKVQISTDMAVDASASTMGQKLGGALGGVTSGFSLAQGAFAAFGSESKEVEQALLKVQAAMAIQQGVQGIREATPAIKALANSIKAAIGSTGVGLIVIALVAVVAYWEDISKAVGFSTKESEKYAKQQKIIGEQAKKQREEVAKQSSGFASLITQLKATNVNSEERVKLIKKINDNYGTTIQNLKDETKFQNSLNVELASYLEYQKAKYALQKNDELIQKNLAKQDELRAKIAKAQKDRDKAIEEGAGKQKRTLEEGIITYVNLNEEADKTLAKVNETISKSNKELIEAKQRFENYGIALNKAEKNIDKLTEGGKKYVEQIKVEKKEEVKKFEEKLHLDTVKLEKLKITTDTQTQIIKDASSEQFRILREAAEKENLLLQQKANQANKILEQANSFKVKMVLEGLSIISDVTELFGKKGEKQARNAFKIQKAANIASATIQTYQSAAGAYASQFLPLPDPSSPVRGQIAAGIAVAGGLVRVAKIASQKFEGGGSAGGGGGGGGATVPTMSAPQFNVVGQSGVNQLASLNQQPIQAYVVSGQVTSQQALDRNRLANATLGG
jgi:hypothetical protein